MSFKKFLQLDEKLILYNHGKRYGQIVFLAGGAGSGKGFALNNFMEKEKFKIRDVDEWKLSFLRLAKEKDKYPELKDLNLKMPKDVFKLHMFIKEKGIKEKSLDYLLQNANNPETLPNIMFDITLKDLDDINQTIPSLISIGYKPENIHLSWVLANYHQAVEANSKRARVVPDNILLATHDGAAKTMWNIIQSKKLPENMDGEVRIILNNRENTTLSKQKNSKGDRIVVGFDYLTIKKSGKSFISSDEVSNKLKDWVTSNIPKSKETQDIHS
jgi:hypothetical protein